MRRSTMPSKRARACYEAASVLLEERPEEPAVSAWSALILLGVGRNEEALRAAQEGESVELVTTGARVEGLEEVVPV